MPAWKNSFIEFALSRDVLKFGEFTLKSGRKSPYFFNAGLFNRGGDLARLGQFYATALIEHHADFDVLFGPAYKGIPIVTATAIALFEQHGKDIPYCFNRKQAKAYGEGGVIVGGTLQGKVMLVDDVITAGTAIREAMTIIRSHQASLTGVLISLDRQERGEKQLSAIDEVKQRFHCRVISIITFDDLVCFLHQQPGMHGHLAAMLAYRETYGARDQTPVSD